MGRTKIESRLIPDIHLDVPIGFRPTLELFP